MNDTMDLPPIDAALIDEAPRSNVALSPTASLDLATIDLKAVALAKFEPQREFLALAKKTLTGVVHDLPTQAKVDEAVSLRNRLIKQPIADARATSKALKSRLTAVAKDVTAEEESIVSDFDETALLITPQIDAAQKKIDDDKAAAKLAKEEGLQNLRDQVDAIIAPWLARCEVADITAERIGKGIDQFTALPMPAELADVKAHWATAHAAALFGMGKMRDAAQKREDAAALEAQRIEAARIAAEQKAEAARLAAERKAAEEAAAARQRELDEREAALQRQADELAAKVAAAAEAQRKADEETEAARLHATTPAAPVATAAATLGTAVTPEPEQLEAAPDTTEQDLQPVLKAEAARPDATDRETPAHASPVGGPMGAGQPAAAGPTSEQSTSELAATGMRTFDGPAAFADLDRMDAELSAEIEAAGGIDAWRAKAATKAPPEEDTEDEERGIDTQPFSDVMRDRALDLKVLADEARKSKFPKQPKMGPEWFAALYAAIDGLAVAAGVA